MAHLYYLLCVLLKLVLNKMLIQFQNNWTISWALSRVMEYKRSCLMDLFILLLGCTSVRYIILNFVGPFEQILFFLNLLILERERGSGERKRERGVDVNLLFYLFMHSLVDSCILLGWVFNLQPWCIRMMLQPTDLPGQG